MKLFILFCLLLFSVIPEAFSQPARIAASQVTAVKKDSLQIDSLNNAAWKTRATDPHKSLVLLQKSAQLQQSTGTTYKQDVLYYYFGVVYKNLNRFTESETYLDKYEAIQSKAKNIPRLAVVKMAKANLYSDQGLWNKSMDAVTQSLKYSEQLNDTAGMVKAMSKLGYLLTEVNRPRDAIRYHQQAMRYAAAQYDSVQMSIAYTNLGVVYEKMKNNDSSLYFYSQSLKINESLQDDMGLTYDYFNVGNIKMKEGDYKAAEQDIRKSLYYAEKINSPGEIMSSRLLLGTLLLSKGETAAGAEILESTISNKELSISLKDQSETYRDLYNAYKTLGQNNKALVALEKYKLINDSMLNENIAGQLNQLEVQYQTAKKEKEIAMLSTKNELSAKEIAFLHVQEKLNAVALLRERERRQALLTENALMDSIVEKEKINNGLLASENKLKETELHKETALKASLNRENELKSSQLKKEKTVKAGLITGLALLLLSAGVILFLYQNQKKKNLLIQKQADDLQVLMKEIHHRVKNNLQIVSSLLDLQSHSITDAQAHEAVKEGKNRVQSMALIHQNLYSEGNIKGIRLKEYVSNLLQTLCDSYNISNDTVKINADIDDLNLDVDTMIPLGLVLNELVSNSFKYAFKEQRQGELTILLKEQAAQLHLMVGDNGAGFPEGLDVKNNKSFGLKMIRAFAQKLKAQLDIYNNNGAVVEMKISKFKTA